MGIPIRTEQEFISHLLFVSILILFKPQYQNFVKMLNYKTLVLRFYESHKKEYSDRKAGESECSTYGL